MKPFKAKSVLKEKIWGGQRLKSYNKSFESSSIGESWETDKDSMPVLIKLIDACDMLSVQVHPDDNMALRLEQQKNGKTEAWIILDCEEGAMVVAGTKQGITQSQLMSALENGFIQEYLNFIKVKRGDCIYIPAGTVHSLGKGILVYEVQQPSDLTYRLYDWDRLDEQGKSRELHVLKALESIDYRMSELLVTNLYEKEIQPQQEQIIFQNDYFTTSYLSLNEGESYLLQSSGFVGFTLISGAAFISYNDSEEIIQKGNTWIAPEACLITLWAKENSELIITRHP